MARGNRDDLTGDTVDALKLGTVSPLYKDLSRFRPVTLLEPIDKCCMATMGHKLSELLFKNKLLDRAQYGSVIDGSCIEPLTIANRLYERARTHSLPLHLAFLDATSAFDSVPHVTLDAALYRMGATPSFVTWLRSMLHGHQRVVATAYGVSPENEATRLQAGEPQGCLASPIIWAIVMDFALTYSRTVGGRGFDLDNIPVQELAFADDLASADNTQYGLQLTIQAQIVALGALGCRFNAPKSYYAWSLGAETDEKPPPPLTVFALDANGHWRATQHTSVPPRGDPDGETLAERGALRYLGALLSFEGYSDEGRWQEQRLMVDASCNALFARCALLKPSLRQFIEAVHAVLLGKILCTWRLVPPEEAQLSAVRVRIARRAAVTLGIGLLAQAHAPEGRAAMTEALKWIYNNEGPNTGGR